MLQKTHRLDFLKQRADGFTLSLCETFAFTASETVSIGWEGDDTLYMQRESADFPGASCDKSQNSGDECGWW